MIDRTSEKLIGEKLLQRGSRKEKEMKKYGLLLIVCLLLGLTGCGNKITLTTFDGVYSDCYAEIHGEKVGTNNLTSVSFGTMGKAYIVFDEYGDLYDYTALGDTEDFHIFKAEHPEGYGIPLYLTVTKDLKETRLVPVFDKDDDLEFIANFGVVTLCTFVGTTY